jgi:hypothetical protein
MLAAFRVGAHWQRLRTAQNGTASTGKLNHSNVGCGKASNPIAGFVARSLPNEGEYKANSGKL